MQANNVPTADFLIIDQATDVDHALDQYSGNPWVIKRDVLAGGKGVVVTEDRAEAKEFIQQSINSDGQVLLEAFLPGNEASMLVVMDGSGFVCLPASQDHKREFEGDKAEIQEEWEHMHLHLFTHKKSKRKPSKESSNQCIMLYLIERVPYRGVLYVGLMIDSKNDPYVVEFNVRFGDPECQITIPLIESDLGELLLSAATDNLSHTEVKFSKKHAMTVVLAAENYPGAVEKVARLQVCQIQAMITGLIMLEQK